MNIERKFASGVHALDAVSLDIRAGEFVALLGPSGCGKSTLLRLIAGLDRPTTGTVDLEPAGKAAFVFQDAHLLPWRDVIRNVELPLELQGQPRAARRAAALKAIDAVGLSDARDRYPAQLSGGMKMRASLARALVNQPQLLLLDEPFAALDEITRQQLDDQLRSLWTERCMTVLFVTHSIMEAAYLADRVLVMSRRPGRIVLDHESALPKARTAELRGQPEFAREMHTLFEALRSGGIA